MRSVSPRAVGRETDPLNVQNVTIPTRPKYELVLTGDWDRTPIIDYEEQQRNQARVTCVLTFFGVFVFLGLVTWGFFYFERWRTS
jgi:hypothetical protein